MAHKKPTPTPPLPTTRSADLQLVESAIEVIRSVPPWNPWIRNAPHSGRGDRVRITEQLKTDLLPLLVDLARLHVEFIPDARLPAPCSFSRGGTFMRTPVENLLACADACVPCCGEALRALRLVADGLNGGDPYGKFLPSDVIAARIIAGQQKADGERRERENRQVPSLRVVEQEDGTVIMQAGALVSASDTARAFQFEGAGQELPLALKKFARHLITWQDLIEYLQEHGIRSVPKSAKKIRPALPLPAFEAPSHRSLYRFASAMRTARMVSGTPAAFASLTDTEWLRGRLHPPEHRPAWAKDRPSGAPGA